MTELPLECDCGAVRGIARDISPETVNRVVCYCDDCQKYAHALGRPDVLNAHGGTDISQLSPCQVEITAGWENVAVLRLTEGGLMRWHTTCCHTPIGNTMARPSPPFLGLIHTFVNHQADGRERIAVMGPVRAGVHGRFAVGDRATLHAHPTAPAWVGFRIARLMFRWWWRGDGKRNPLFEGSEPRGPVRIL